MNLRCATVVLGICAILSGCRTPDPTVELLESELRWLEDQLYLLDEQLDHSSAQLESCQRNNQLLRQELAQAQDGRGKPADTARDVPPDDDIPSDEELFDFIPPVINPGDPDEPGRPGEAGEPSGPPAARPPVIESPAETNPDRSSRDGAPAGLRRVTQIKLNRQLTGGYDLDGKPGDEGVMIVIEPQNDAGQYVALAGGVTVAVSDSQTSGVAGRVAKWKFDEVETAAFLKQSLLGRGIHLKLPWPAEPPPRDELRLVVDYQTIDGRTLRAERAFKIEQPTAQHDQADIPPWSPKRMGQPALLPHQITTAAKSSSAARVSKSTQGSTPRVGSRLKWKPPRP